MSRRYDSPSAIDDTIDRLADAAFPVVATLVIASAALRSLARRLARRLDHEGKVHHD